MPTAQTYQSEFTGQQMDDRLAAVATLAEALTAVQEAIEAKYTKPAGGIPATDLDADVNAALAKANSAVQSLADYYTKSEVDQLLAAINGMEYVAVAALPTASASTMGKIYLVGPDGSGYYSYYFTSYDGSAYSWMGPLGTTEISFAGYATKAALSQLDQKVNLNFDSAGLVQELTVNRNRLSQGVQCVVSGKCKVKLSLVSGTDAGRFRVYRNQSGTMGTNLCDLTALGTAVDITIPSGDYGIWIFTEDNSIVTARTYKLEVYDFEETLITYIDEIDTRLSVVEDGVLGTLASVNMTENSGRVSHALYLGHPGESAYFKLSLVSGTDTDGYRLYSTGTGGTLDTSTIILSDHNFGTGGNITIPASGYVWIFTLNNSVSTPRTYHAEAYDNDAISQQIVKLSEDVAELQKLPLYGKKIVCFGDSITEFDYQGHQYTDYLAQYSGATVINVGIGGTQIRQRATPTLTPTTSEQCYAGLDIVNMVKAAMTEDYSIVEAAANKLATISADDNTAIITRLEGIDWDTVNYVFVFAGTNDWMSNGGSTGDAETTDINYTCGAINDIIERICTNHKGVKLYWFTPIIRCVDAPDFSTEVSYNVGDMCTYSGNYYRFINAHQGAWNSADVTQITRVDMRVPALYSDNVEKNGKTLREFSAIIESATKNQHIPTADLYNGLGWNLYNFSQFFPDTDNTHPLKGLDWLADKMYRFVLAH